MLIIRISPPALPMMKIFKLVFKDVNLKVLKNAITFWFHNQPNCFKPYILFKSLNEKPTLTNWKFFILSYSFIKIGSLLSSIKLSKYALTMSICSIKNLKTIDIAKKILSNLHYTVGANILLKSMPSIWKYF